MNASPDGSRTLTSPRTPHRAVKENTKSPGPQGSRQGSQGPRPGPQGPHIGPLTSPGSHPGSPGPYTNSPRPYTNSPGPNTNSPGPSSHNIRVVCRVKPLSGTSITTSTDSSVTIRSKDSTHQYTFDRVFGSDSSQTQIYQDSVQETVDEVFNGYNGTILAYGQTGSGKSHTMLGPSLSDGTSKGIVPRIADGIFDRISGSSSHIEYTVSLSVMEIYLENINDLLVPENTRLSIHEDRTHGVYVKGLSHGSASSAHDLYRLIQLGTKNRASYATAMNMESSRSHCIFQIQLSQKDLRSDSIKRSNLFLIDLAGSEKIDRSGVIGQSLEEVKNINSSLSALGNVIYALTDNKSRHIPYRDSKLTRILQESLGGNSRTWLLLTISPLETNELETLSTLRFGTRAKTIKNKAFVNSELSNEELQGQVNRLKELNRENKEYIEELEKRVKGSRDWDLGPGPQDLGPGPQDLGPGPGPGPGPNPTSQLQEKDQKIIQLEQELINNKIKAIEISNAEEIKLNKLEKALNKLLEKLTEVEIINVNLRKHLLLSERVIESRERTIEDLTTVINDQKRSLSERRELFNQKLGALEERLPKLPKLPKTGLNLGIIRPVMGGNSREA